MFTVDSIGMPSQQGSRQGLLPRENNSFILSKRYSILIVSISTLNSKNNEDDHVLIAYVMGHVGGGGGHRDGVAKFYWECRW